MASILRWGLVLGFLAGLLPPAMAGDGSTPELSIQLRGSWKLIESANFRCWSQLADEEARQLTQSCELWRNRLRAQWINDASPSDWTPKCDVVVHPQRDQYTRALNRPGDASVGSTRMNFDQGRTVFRRIDVRADASDWSNAALPHELTHVVLGERFGGRVLPRWADEGIAMLSESQEKHHERRTDLLQGLAKRPQLSMRQMTQPGFAIAPPVRDAFYGQSLALSSLLISKSSPATFADFVEDAGEGNLDTALRRHYGLEGVTDLQQEWDRWVSRPEGIQFVALQIQQATDVKVTENTP